MTDAPLDLNEIEKRADNSVEEHGWVRIDNNTAKSLTEDIPALCAEVRRLQARVEELEVVEKQMLRLATALKGSGEIRSPDPSLPDPEAP